MTPHESSTNESWWWCCRCKGYVELRDPGEVWPQCAVCGGRKVDMRKPAPTPDKVVTNGQFAHAWFERMRTVVDGTNG